MIATENRELCSGISIERVGSVLFLVFDAGASRNAVTLNWSIALRKFAQNFSEWLQFGATSTHPTAGALVLISKNPKTFLSGGDLKEIASLSLDQSWEFTSNMRHFCRFLSNCSVPSVSYVAGDAYGGGVEVALATDYRLTGDSPELPQAALHLWQSKWGLPGGWRGMGRLEELCPHLSRRAVSLLFARAASLKTATLREWKLLEELSDVDLSSASFANAPQTPSVLKEDTTSWHWICKLSVDFLACPAELRQDLLSRCETRDAKQESFDKEIFAKHWHGPAHKMRLAEFLTRKEI